MPFRRRLIASPRPATRRELVSRDDAIEILVRYADLSRMTPEEARTIQILQGQLAQVAQIKQDTKPAPAG